MSFRLHGLRCQCCHSCPEPSLSGPIYPVDYSDSSRIQAVRPISLPLLSFPCLSTAAYPSDSGLIDSRPKPAFRFGSIRFISPHLLSFAAKPSISLQMHTADSFTATPFQCIPFRTTTALPVGPSRHASEPILYCHSYRHHCFPIASALRPSFP